MLVSWTYLKTSIELGALSFEKLLIARGSHLVATETTLSFKMKLGNTRTKR